MLHKRAIAHDANSSDNKISSGTNATSTFSLINFQFLSILSPAIVNNNVLEAFRNRNYYYYYYYTSSLLAD